MLAYLGSDKHLIEAEAEEKCIVSTIELFLKL
jgi:hypothetical protein